MEDAFFLMQKVERIWPDEDAGGEIAKNGAQLETIENRHGDCGGPEIGRRLDKKIAVIAGCHVAPKED